MTARLHADVAIVGAGPAGSAAALLLARAGVDVLLLDRSRFPRAKPCGDCLSAAASPILERLGVLDDVLAGRPARLLGWRIVAPRGAVFEQRFNDVAGDAHVDSALALDRASLDRILCAAAVRAGARFFAPAHVTTLSSATTHGRTLLARAEDGALEIRAPLVVGADGLRSIIARRMGAAAPPGRIRKLSLTAHIDRVRIGAFGEMHVGDGICAGVAPVQDGDEPRCNVTLVADARRFGRAAAADPAAFFHARLRDFPALPDCLRTPPPRNGAPPGQLLASGPFDRPTRAVTAHGLALVGDAAGYFDPFTGQGIHQALAGAELLAAAVLRLLDRGDFSAGALQAYARALRRMTRPARVLQRAIDATLARPRLADAAIARLARRPTAARAILAATGDLRSPFSLLSPAPLLSFAGPRWMERLL